MTMIWDLLVCAGIGFAVSAPFLVECVARLGGRR